MGLSSKKTVQSNEPWQAAQPYIIKGLEQTGRVFDANQPSLDKYAAESFGTYGRVAPGAEQGINLSQDFTNRTLAGDFMGKSPGSDLYNRTMGGEFLNNNPYLDGVLAKTRSNIANDVNSQFSTAGRYGSGAHTGVLGERMAEAENAARLSNYQTERDRQMGAAGALDQLYAADLNRMSGATDTAQALMSGSQGLLNQTAELPWIGVQALNGNVRQASSGYGTTTSKSSGGMFDSLLGAGALVGSAAIKASDERLKKNKHKIGEIDDGLGLYSYQYKPEVDPSGAPQIGVMAQEVEQKRPDALGPEIGGFKTVNYGALGQPNLARMGGGDLIGVQRGDVGEMSPELSGTDKPIGDYSLAPLPQAAPLNQPGVAGFLGRVLDPSTNASPVGEALGMFGQALLAGGDGAGSGVGRALLASNKARVDREDGSFNRKFKQAQMAEIMRKATAPQIEKVGDSILSVGADGAVKPLYTGQSDAERYAATLGYVPGTPAYQTAVKDYVLKSSGPTALSSDRELANYRHGLRLNEIGASGSQDRSNASYREGLYRSRPGVNEVTPAKVIGPLMAKKASGMALTPAEEATLNYYKQPGFEQLLLGGGMPGLTPPAVPPRLPTRLSPRAAPRSNSASQTYTRTATDPRTGRKVGFNGKEWVSIR